eukprot:1684772-Alexandrium_andersonii.AAC.1
MALGSSGELPRELHGVPGNSGELPGGPEVRRGPGSSHEPQVPSRHLFVIGWPSDREEDNPQIGE